jgi:hypothetical protein
MCEKKQKLNVRRCFGEPKGAEVSTISQNSSDCDIFWLLITQHLESILYWQILIKKCFIADRLPNMTCGLARDTVLTNRQKEKLNFDTNYITKVHLAFNMHLLTIVSTYDDVFLTVAREYTHISI